jgi:hypothetical protein
MTGHSADLLVGEIIEIKYRVPQPACDEQPDLPLSDRWIAAEIIHLDDDALPLARLSDGQITDIRAYMTWRRVSRFVDANRG